MKKICYTSLDVKIKDKEELFNYASKEIYNADLISSPEEFKYNLEKRENEISTGIGNKIAFPHAKGNFVKHNFVYFIRSLYDIEFNAIDNKKVNLFFIIGTKDKSERNHLKILSKTAKLLLDEQKAHILSTTKDSVLVNDMLKQSLVDEVVIIGCNYIIKEKIIKKYKKDFSFTFIESENELDMFKIKEKSPTISFSPTKSKDYYKVKNYQEVVNVLDGLLMEEL